MQYLIVCFFLAVSQTVLIVLGITSSVVVFHSDKECGSDAVGAGNGYFMKTISVVTFVVVIINFISTCTEFTKRNTKFVAQCLVFNVIIINFVLGLLWIIVGGSMLAYSYTCHTIAKLYISTGISMWFYILVYQVFINKDNANYNPKDVIQGVHDAEYNHDYNEMI